MSTRRYSSEYKALRPFIIEEIRGILGGSVAVAGAVGGIASHALNDTSIHTGQLAQTQAPWASTKNELATHAANPDADAVRIADIRVQATQAQRLPSREPAFRAYVLNQPVQADERFIGPVDWDACAGTAEAMVGCARRSMTPVGVCQTRSMTRGSVTPGGSRKAFVNSVISRGPMPVRDCAEANRGVKTSGRMQAV